MKGCGHVCYIPFCFYICIPKPGLHFAWCTSKQQHDWLTSVLTVTWFLIGCRYIQSCNHCTHRLLMRAFKCIWALCLTLPRRCVFWLSFWLFESVCLPVFLITALPMLLCLCLDWTPDLWLWFVDFVILCLDLLKDQFYYTCILSHLDILTVISPKLINSNNSTWQSVLLSLQQQY